MKSEDDPRSVDWAPRQIKRIDKDINAAAQKLNQLDRQITENAQAIDAVSEDLAGTDRGVVHQNERLSAVERRVMALEGWVGQPTDLLVDDDEEPPSLWELIDGLDTRIDRMSKDNRDRLGLTRRVERISDRVTETNKRLTNVANLFNQLREMHHKLQGLSEVGWENHSALTDSVERMSENFTTRADALVALINELDKRISGVVRWQGEHGRVFREHLGKFQEVRDAVKHTENVLRHSAEEFSPVIGTNSENIRPLDIGGVVERNGGLFGVGDPQREAYDKGYQRGKAAAVDEMNSRMVALFDEMGGMTAGIIRDEVLKIVRAQNSGS